MRIRFSASLACFLLGAGVAYAEPAVPTLSPPPNAQPAEAPAPAPTAPIETRTSVPPAWSPTTQVSQTSCLFGERCDVDSRLWGSAEYLLWWFRGGPVPVPLVSTGPPGSAGILDQPGSGIVFGNSELNYGTTSGLRLALGSWLDINRLWGVEGNVFLMESRAAGVNVGSDGAGNPVLAVPFLNALTRTGSVVLAANPAILGFTQSGALDVLSRSRLWGAEVNTVVNLRRNTRTSTDLLVGFRYLDLDEFLLMGIRSFQDFGAAGSDLVFGFDRFDTRNQFYGGQVGARFGTHWGCLGLDLVGKIALGGSHQVVGIDGGRSQLGISGGQPTFQSAGLTLALPTNVGVRSRSEFAVIPELQLQLGYDVTPNVHAFVGYNYIYWSDVVRPGDQIDPVINPSQRLGNPLFGPARPLPLFRCTDFWAHGVNFGVEYRY